MCTVTLIRKPHGMCITMNRDEKRTRGHERPPEVLESSSVIAPCDVDGGGTWIGLSPSGYWACLLNRYESFQPAENPPSRGRIIPEILSTMSPVNTLLTMDVTRYRPFSILIGDAASVDIFHWNGERLIIEEKPVHEDVMISSSSWDAENVIAARMAAFEQWKGQGRLSDAEGIPLIHRWQESGESTSGILMSRDESRTTSITQIAFFHDDVPKMRYWPASELQPFSMRE
ncbi:MAG: NRDE family protein [Rickettsiales bacterium]|nr:NRDE family protein [Rickettsiales bacterium]